MTLHDLVILIRSSSVATLLMLMSCTALQQTSREFESGGIVGNCYELQYGEWRGELRPGYLPDHTGLDTIIRLEDRPPVGWVEDANRRVVAYGEEGWHPGSFGYWRRLDSGLTVIGAYPLGFAGFDVTLDLREAETQGTIKAWTDDRPVRKSTVVTARRIICPE